MQLAPLASLAALATVAAATGSAIVHNKCSFPVYLWSTDPSTEGPEQNLTAGTGSYSEVYRGSGISLKIATNGESSAPYDPNVPLTQFQYTLDGSTVYYALADMRGDPFLGHDVVLQPSTGGTTITWSNGTGPSAVYTCGNDADLTLTLCA